MPSSTGNEKKSLWQKIQSKAVKTPILIVLVLVAIGGSFLLGYSRGHEAGQKASADALKKSINDLVNPMNILSKNPLFPTTVIGKFDSLSGSKLSVKLANGTTSSVIINKDTKVTQNSKTIKLADVKKDSNLTVFTQKQDKNSSDKDSPIASRIIVR